jgi:hypothetical protein
LRRFADHPDLLAVGPDEAGDDDGDDRVAHVLAQHLFDFARQLDRGLALRHQFVHQRGTDLAVGPAR